MAMPASPPPATIVPAQLGFLAIFNPTLGTTDETIDDQIVYYASVNTQSQKKRHRSRGKPTENISQDERNERLRQIGLAQGMVEFSRGFASGKPVDTIETEKSRVVLHELEPGWWILASIDLTKLPLPPRLGSSSNKSEDTSENVEYSSREVKPAALLLQDLLRAHSIFLLHHAASLSALFVRSKRSKFVGILSRYWDLFLSTWNVMLHGNPAVNVLGGIKIAACGELGVGVGEEDRGSGEREVLEGFIDRTEGLVDLVVSKFGPADPETDTDPPKDKNPGDEANTKWLGTGEEPGAEDGAVFLGAGALSRNSLRDLVCWMEDLYTWGEDAYGVKDSPTSTRQARKPRKSVASTKVTDSQSKKVSIRAESIASEQSDGKGPPSEPTGTGTASPTPTDDAANEGSMHKVMNYLRMGYGTHWTLGSSGGGEGTDQGGEVPKKDKILSERPRRPSRAPSDDVGHYLIGLLGDVEENGTSDNSDTKEQSDSGFDEVEYNSRVLLRTLTVELDGPSIPEAEVTQDLGSQAHELRTTQSGRMDPTDPNSHFNSQDRNKTNKIRVVVYVSKPFIYTFLFQNRTDSLAWDSLYRSLHYQLAPLRKPLAASTAYRPGKPDVGAVASHIFDLVWDPKAMTIHSTIPNIPDPAYMVQENREPFWSRVEAINTHNQILNIYIAAQTGFSELERTCKTSRGWWIVWTRILDKESAQRARPSVPEHEVSDESDESRKTSNDSENKPIPSLQASESAGSMNSNGPTRPTYKLKPRVSKEIFLIRRAGEHAALRAISTSYAEGSGGWGDGASRLAQGIGVDTKKYIEGLLSLSR